MLRALIALLRKPREPQAEPSALELARRARRTAAAAYARAVEAEDTRAQHWAHKRFKAATHELMRVERAEGCR